MMKLVNGFKKMHMGHFCILAVLLLTAAGAEPSFAQSTGNIVSVAGAWPKGVSLNSLSSPAVGDIDGDGSLEVVIGDLWRVQAWKKDGSPVSGWPKIQGQLVSAAPALVDLDRDGSLEVITADTNGKVYITRADGSDFLPGVWPKTTSDRIDETPVVADIDGDSQNEILVVNAKHDFYVWRQDGSSFLPYNSDGMFRSAGSVSTNRSMISVADLTGDGRLEIITLTAGDLVVYNQDKSVRWMLRLGGAGYKGLVVGDLNHDGNPEVVVSTATTVSAFSKDGVMQAGWPFTLSGQGVNLGKPVVGDINGDLKLETIVTTDKGAVFALNDQGVNIFQSISYPQSMPVTTNPLVGDVDSDGINDVVIVNGDVGLDGSRSFIVRALKNNGSMVPGYPLYQITPLKGAGVPVRDEVPAGSLVDLDQDGKIDLLTPSITGVLYAVKTAAADTLSETGWPMAQHDLKRTGSGMAGELTWVKTATPQDVTIFPGTTVEIDAMAAKTGGSMLYYDCLWFLNGVRQTSPALPSRASLVIGRDLIARLIWNVPAGISMTDKNAFEFRVRDSFSNAVKLVKTIQVKITPAAPTKLAGSLVSGQPVLTWVASVGAVSCNVKRSDVSGGPFTTISQAGAETGTSFTDTTAFGQKYYVVSAVNAAGESVNSAQVSVLAWPAAPTEVTAVVRGSELAVSWNLSEGAVFYRVYVTDVSTNILTVIGPYITSSAILSSSIVKPGKSYMIRVQASNGAGFSPAGIQVPVLMAPAAPTEVAGSLVSGQPVLTWGASVGAVSYNVKRSDVNGGPYTTLSQAGAVTGTSFTDTTAFGQKYYVVSAVNAAGESVNSAQVSMLAWPAVPTEVTAVVRGSEVAVSWNLSEGAAFYNIYVIDVSTNILTVIGQYITSSAILSSSIVKPGKSYMIRVQASNGAGYNPAGIQVPVLMAPAAPTEVAGSLVSGQPVLTWGASVGAASYNVKRSDVSGGPFTTISQAGAVTGTSFTDTTAFGQKYYVVSAVNATGESVNSAQVSVLAWPAAQTEVTAVFRGSELAVSWNLSEGAVFYRIYLTDVSTNILTVIGPYITSSAILSSSFVKPGKSYMIHVQASNGAGFSPAGIQVPVLMAPAAPTEVAGSLVSGQPVLTWGASVGAVSYNVKRSDVNGGPFTTISQAGAVTGTSFTDTTAFGQKYYVVSAVNAAGESVNSAQVSVTSRPAAPTGVTAVVRGNEVTVNWNSSEGAANYYVSAKDVTMNTTTLRGPYKVSSVVLGPSELAPGKSYTIGVLGSNSAGYSPVGVQVSVVMPSGRDSLLGTFKKMSSELILK